MQHVRVSKGNGKTFQIYRPAFIDPVVLNLVLFVINDIKISDTAEITAKKVMSAITDRSRMRKDDPGHPDECEVAFKYWKIFGEEAEIETVKCECEKGLRGCADCKRQLGAKINERLAEIRERRRYYEEHPEEVERIIKEGSERARVEAQKVLAEVRKLVRMY